jgi:protein TonB
LILKVAPIYPDEARRARVQGTVILQVVIGKEGTIENLHVVSGDSLLVDAATDAVRQWRYRPYVLNGAPVEIDTTVEIHFTLN